MSDDLVIVPSNGDSYVELARTRTGRLFRKHLLNLETLKHPATGKDIKIDDTFVKTLTKNFRDGVCDIVQVPLANDKNEHTENPERNIGEVVDIQVKDKKLYAILDVRDDTHADKLGKTYLGASAMMHLDYTDTKTGKKVGPTLLHSCVTNRPYVTGLEPYEEIVAATSDRSEEAVVLLTDDVDEVEPTKEPEMAKEETQETATKPTLEELFEALKSEHNIDVPALQAKATEGTEKADQAANLSKTLLDALTNAGVVKLTQPDGDDTVTNDEVVGAVAKVAEENVTLTNRLTALERERAEDAVQRDIDGGFIKPAKKKDMVELKLSNPSLYDAVKPDDPIVKLNNETGVTPPKDENHKKDIDGDIKRYVELANSFK